MPAPWDNLSNRARLRLKYYQRIAVGGSWVDRLVHASEVRVEWNEAATRDQRTDVDDWNADYGQFGTEINATPESSVLFTDDTVILSWQSWQLTDLVKQWLADPDSNHGVMLWADNEDTIGYDLRFRSSDDNKPDEPELQVIWYQSTRSVYYFKDHPESLRSRDKLSAVSAPRWMIFDRVVSCPRRLLVKFWYRY